MAAAVNATFNFYYTSFVVCRSGWDAKQEHLRLHMLFLSATNSVKTAKEQLLRVINSCMYLCKQMKNSFRILNK